MTKPGLWLQRITTQPCDDSQVECAIHALDQAMQLEKQDVSWIAKVFVDSVPVFDHWARLLQTISYLGITFFD